MGFEAKHFLERRVTPIDYRELFESNRQNLHAGEVDFSGWCIEYIKHLFSARHGCSEDHLRYAQDALIWGSKLYPELRQTAARIDSWFETGAFKDPDQYPRQINLLLELVRIPRFDGWATLKGSEQKRPVATRLDIDGICRGV
jgi:hypothetical protein